MFSKVRKIFTGVPLFRRFLIINSRSLIVMASNWQSAHMKQKEQCFYDRINHVKGHVAVEVSEDQTESSAVLPGFSYGDLDRTGDVEAWRIMMLVQTGEDNCAFRGKSQQERDVFDMSEILKDRLVFSVQTKLDVMPEMYTRKDDFLYQPVIFRQYLNKIGNTSFEIIRELHCQKGFPLVRAAQGLVIVDKETHSPAQHPDSFVKKFGNVRPKIIIERFMSYRMPSECYTANRPSNCPRDSTELKEMVLCFRPDEKPENAFRTSYRVNWSDTDYYYHSNQTSYLRYAINGATEACFADLFKQFPAGDLANHKVHCMTMLYASETKPGDKLDIYVWEDKLINKRLHCQLEKDGQLVYNTAIDYFDTYRIEKSTKGKDSKI